MDGNELKNNFKKIGIRYSFLKLEGLINSSVTIQGLGYILLLLLLNESATELYKLISDKFNKSS